MDSIADNLIRARFRVVATCVLLVTAACSHESQNQAISDAAPPDHGSPKASYAVSTEAKPIPAQVPVKRQDWNQLDNAANDGWDTEVFADTASSLLKQLGKVLSNPANIDTTAVESLINSDFKCSPLVPNLEIVYSDAPLVVEKASSQQPTKQIGAEDFAAELRRLAIPGCDATHTKFKVFRVSSKGDEVETQQYVSLAGSTSESAIERHATWKIIWMRTHDRMLPRIKRLEVTEFEQTTRNSAQWFRDCTAAMLGEDPCYRSQILQGYGSWLARIPHGIYLEVVGTPGFALGDVNGDGREDMYFCQERGLPNRLFLQQPDGTVRDVSADWGVDWLESSRAALLVDLDNDADQDLVVSVMGGVVVAANENNARFQFRDLLPTNEDVMSLSAADYDNDGDLDLYACGYYANKGLDRHGNAGTSALPTADEGFVMHDANVGGPNHLIRNDIESSDNWKFSDVTTDVGLDANNRRFTFASAWEDFDNDGDLDLYVVNEFGRDNMYRNDDGRFADVSDNARVEDAGSGMGITWGDYDRDGRMDVYISNMFSAAGNRITFQEKFKADSPGEVKRRIQRLARGNTLLQNLGEGRFRDQSAGAGVEMGRWSWASQFVDLNNDSWVDLLVANGYITADDTGDL